MKANSMSPDQTAPLEDKQMRKSRQRVVMGVGGGLYLDRVAHLPIQEKSKLFESSNM